ncbi:MAG: MFS transporter [Oscillospiraceae bacterium]|nr:MFS transporter [Oscillospiraceae bacterium]
MKDKTAARWPRAAAGIVMMIFIGSMYTWSYFKVALGEVFPTWTEKEITLNFTLMMCLFCIGGVAAGRLSSHVSQTIQIRLAGILMGVGFLGVSFLPRNSPGAALILLYVFYAGLNGLGTGIAFNATMAAVQPWFLDRTGLVSGALLMSLCFGTLLLGNGAAALINAIGLFPTFRLLGIADLVVILAVSPLIRQPGPQDRVPAPAQAEAASAVRDYTTPEMLRRPTFWLYFCWNVCISAGGMLVINSASSISVYYGAAATIGLLVSVFNGGGRLLSGWLMDRLGWKPVLYLVNGVMLVAGMMMVAGDRSGFHFPVFCGMMLLGCCYGSGISIASSLIRRLYGNRHYASNFSMCNLCTFPAAVIGPLISAALQDASAGYTSTFLMVAVISCVALVINLFIRKP